MGGEDIRQPKYFAAAGEPKQIWKVPGAEHTGGIDARPAEYERRVIGFLDGALLRQHRVTSRGGHAARRLPGVESGLRRCDAAPRRPDGRVAAAEVLCTGR